MNDFLGRLLAIVLVCLLAIMAPLTINGLIMDLTATRSIYNEVSNLIDKVTDTGELSEITLADFYLGCNAYGVITDVDIERNIKVINPDGKGSTVTTYIKSDKIDEWNQGDIITVRVRAIDYTGAQKILWYLINLAVPRMDITLSGGVR